MQDPSAVSELSCTPRSVGRPSSPSSGTSGEVLLFYSTLEQPGAGAGGEVSFLGAHNKTLPVMSAEGVTSERLLSALGCLIVVVVAAQETMFVFLCLLSAPGEKPNCN